MEAKKAVQLAACLVLRLKLEAKRIDDLAKKADAGDADAVVRR